MSSLYWIGALVVITYPFLIPVNLFQKKRPLKLDMFHFLSRCWDVDHNGRADRSSTEQDSLVTWFRADSGLESDIYHTFKTKGMPFSMPLNCLMHWNIFQHINCNTPILHLNQCWPIVNHVFLWLRPYPKRSPQKHFFSLSQPPYI